MKVLNSQVAKSLTRARRENGGMGAVIDIGTNGIKLLVGQLGSSGIQQVYAARESVQVGHGTFQTRRIREDMIARAATTVGEFVRCSRQFSPSILRILATSAVREAINRTALVRAVEIRSSHPVEVLSGHEEGRLLFEALRREPGIGGSPLLVFDVGGGSTQVIVSEHVAGAMFYSFPFGSLRLFESLGLSAPLSRAGLARCRAAAANFLGQQVIPAIGMTRFEGTPFNVMRLVTTGRKLQALAAAANSTRDSQPKNGIVTLTSKKLSAMIDGLWGMTSGERARMLSIPEEDADVVLTAAVTLEAVLQRFDFEMLQVCRGSLRHGALLRAFAERRRAALDNTRLSL